MLNQDKKKLKNIFGFDDYKNNQQEIIKEVLEGKNILTVMPTGGGKSLCYQLPATLFDGLTKKRKMKTARHIRVKVMKLMMIFSFVFFSHQSFALEQQLIEEYKKIRSVIEENQFAISDNYYFLFGSVTVDDYEEDIEFIAEANAYENLDVYAFNQICSYNSTYSFSNICIFAIKLESI